MTRSIFCDQCGAQVVPGTTLAIMIEVTRLNGAVVLLDFERVTCMKQKMDALLGPNAATSE